MNTSTLILRSGRRWLLYLLVVITLTWSSWMFATAPKADVSPVTDAIEPMQMAGPQEGFGG